MLRGKTAAQLRQIASEASEGIRQSPRGESAIVPTFGPSGMQLRLNCCWKKRRRKIFNVRSIVSSSYTPANAAPASARIFSGSAPYLMK